MMQPQRQPITEPFQSRLLPQNREFKNRRKAPKGAKSILFIRAYKIMDEDGRYRTLQFDSFCRKTGVVKKNIMQMKDAVVEEIIFKLKELFPSATIIEDRQLNYVFMNSPFLGFYAIKH